MLNWQPLGRMRRSRRHILKRMNAVGFATRTLLERKSVLASRAGLWRGYDVSENGQTLGGAKKRILC